MHLGKIFLDNRLGKALNPFLFILFFYLFIKKHLKIIIILKLYQIVSGEGNPKKWQWLQKEIL